MGSGDRGDLPSRPPHPPDRRGGEPRHAADRPRSVLGTDGLCDDRRHCGRDVADFAVLSGALCRLLSRQGAAAEPACSPDRPGRQSSGGFRSERASAGSCDREIAGEQRRLRHGRRQGARGRRRLLSRPEARPDPLSASSFSRFGESSSGWATPPPLREVRPEAAGGRQARGRPHRNSVQAWRLPRGEQARGMVRVVPVIGGSGIFS